MKVVVKLVSALAMVAVLSACNEQSKVAVVNVDKVIENTPLKMLMKQNLEAKFNAAKEQLAKQEAFYKEQVETYQEKLGDASTPEAQAKLARAQQQVIAKINEDRVKSNNEMKVYQKQLTQKAMENIKDAANKVAKENGYDIVLAENDLTMLSVSLDVDITGPVAHYVNLSFKKN